MTEETFIVSDIHCQSCEWTIRTLVGDVDGVIDVVPESETNQVSVTYDEATIDRSVVAGALANAGFPEASG